MSLEVEVIADLSKAFIDSNFIAFNSSGYGFVVKVGSDSYFIYGNSEEINIYKYTNTPCYCCGCALFKKFNEEEYVCWGGKNIKKPCKYAINGKCRKDAKCKGYVINGKCRKDGNCKGKDSKFHVVS